MAKRGRPPAHGWSRYAAPAAFLLAATIVVLLVRSALHQASPPVPAPPVRIATSRAPAAPVTTAPARRAGRPRRYEVVRAGDTFGAIAARSGRTVAEIERLNPGVASTSLHVGEKIRVG